MFSRRGETPEPLRSFDLTSRHSILRVALRINGGSQTLSELGPDISDTALDFIQETRQFIRFGIASCASSSIRIVMGTIGPAWSPSLLLIWTIWRWLLLVAARRRGVRLLTLLSLLTL